MMRSKLPKNRYSSTFSSSNLFVTDTHALLWYLTCDGRLGRNAEAAYGRVDAGGAVIIIPTVVLAEAMFITEKHRVDIEFIEILKTIERSLNYIIYPMNTAVVLKCHELKAIPELHDRIISATAILLDSVLITKDREITESGEVAVVW
ncbi:MAG: PIN domain-containing protein [Euryarchaeota archaeon]|nr:PIN domain-containing protein [Euryarchaeota archaeon]